MCSPLDWSLDPVSVSLIEIISLSAQRSLSFHFEYQILSECVSAVKCCNDVCLMLSHVNEVNWSNKSAFDDAVWIHFVYIVKYGSFM